MTITTEFTTPPPYESGFNSDLWMATEARKMGFPVAGTIGEIYEDAVILMRPMFVGDWTEAGVNMGRVLHISESDGVVDFVLETKDGVQVPLAYGRTWKCHFALPEDSEEAFRA